MPRQYDEQAIQHAVEAIKGGMKYREASRRYGIPRTSITRYIKEHASKQDGKQISMVRAGRQQGIPKELEENCVGRILFAAKSGFPMTKDRVLTCFGRLAQQLGLSTQFKNGQPGDKFWRCLKKRHLNLTIRSPECCSRNGLRALNEDMIASYFEDLTKIIVGKKLGPELIWNMDETGLQFPHKPDEVVAEKGEKQLMARCSDSKQAVTVLACANASGASIPPMVIRKGKTMKSVLSFGTYLGPDQARWTNQQKGWMENTLGVEWFEEIFLKHCGLKRPQLLLLDSHFSHEVLGLLEKAKEEGIEIMVLPPHTTQLLQPLDTTVFKPFATAYDKACGQFMFDNPTHVIDKASFPLMLNKAWEVMRDVTLIKNAFQSTGIYPTNPHVVISRDNFLPAMALDRPLMQATTSNTNNSSSSQENHPSHTSGLSSILQELHPPFIMEVPTITETSSSQQYALLDEQSPSSSLQCPLLDVHLQDQSSSLQPSVLDDQAPSSSQHRSLPDVQAPSSSQHRSLPDVQAPPSLIA